MELIEAIAPPKPHAGSSKNCPFCPPEKPDPFTTHPGRANNSGVLEDVMANPATLVAKQGGARPKEGKKAQQKKSRKQPKPSPIFKARPHGDYSCEAHHLISGKQALQGHKFERWIVGGRTIERDSGYSVNNADNGLWAPSIPEKYKDGSWGGMKYADKYAVAEQAMARGLPQFHKGPHNITDPHDPGGIKHKKYDRYLKQVLTEMDRRVRLWADECPQCDNGKKKKFQPSVRINQILDNFSKVVRRKISAPASHWEIFISQLALDYHKQPGRCRHGVSRI